MKQQTMTLAKTHLSTKELANRWGMNDQTLVNWRTQGTGPDYLKIGRRVVYEISVIEKFEAERRKRNTAQY